MIEKSAIGDISVMSVPKLNPLRIMCVRREHLVPPVMWLEFGVARSPVFRE
jgi:hypothetical protein